MKPIWTIITCPIYGIIGKVLREQIQHFPEPWKTHALLTINLEHITTTQTHIVVGLDNKRGLIAYTWLSLPDKKLLSGWKTNAFIFHIHIHSECRGRGIGKHMVRIACSTAERYGVDNVMLATNQMELKQNFYSRLDFIPVSDDPWLMSYRCKQTRKSKYRNSSKSTIYNVRSVSPHDLATVQSICAQKHWICDSASIILSNPTECEEDFSNLFKDNHIYDQFFLRGRYNEREFVSWVNFYDKNDLTQRILCDNKNSEEILILSEKLRNILLKIIHYSGTELLKLDQEAYLSIEEEYGKG